MVAVGSSSCPHAEGALLTNAAQVRALRQMEAATQVPVKLRGTVVVEAENNGAGFVVLDDTEGVYVEGDTRLIQEVRRGDWLEIEGVSDPGGFAPVVLLHTYRKLGEREIPPPQTVTFEQLVVSRFDAQWVEVSGTVRSCEQIATNPPRTAIDLAIDGQRLAVRINAAIPSDRLVDAEVRLRGVCFNQHNANRQFIRPMLHIPQDEPICVTKPAPADPFNVPATSIAALMQFAPDGSYGHRVRVQGIVTHHQPGELIWISDHERGLRVRTKLANSVEPGQTVDVLGFPNRGVYTPILEDAVYRIVATNPPPSPFLLADPSNAPVHDGDLVQFDAGLSEVRQLAQGFPRTVEIRLDWEGEAILASWRPRTDESIPATWRKGSSVRATGICMVTPDQNSLPSGVLTPRAFHLILRSAEDLLVLKPPAWWTAERKSWMASGVAGALLLTVAGIAFTAKRRLREQASRRTTAEAEFSAILSERNRMAREIHDTLAQGLAATSVQLRLVRKTAGGDLDSLNHHLDAAQQLVRESLEEARNSIWNMRSHVLESHDLEGALSGILKQMAEGGELETKVEVSGRTRRFAPVMENNLLRIGQEAITNAIKHGQAQHITVSLTFADTQFRLVVHDDGRGFDPANPSPSAGGFGLMGMRERAAELKATLDIGSAPGRGTQVTLLVPLSRE